MSPPYARVAEAVDRWNSVPVKTPVGSLAALPARVLASRWRWLVPALMLAAWLVISGGGGPYSGRLSEVQKNDASAFLPASAESTKVSDLQRGFSDQRTLPAFALVEAPERLTPEQLAAFGAFARDLPGLEITVDGSAPVKVGDYLAPGPVPVIPSQDGKAALALVNFGAAESGEVLADGESALERAVEEIRTAQEKLETDGVSSYVAGPAGLAADLVDAFGGVDGLLLYVALAAVLLILLVVYRSPFVPVVVLLTVGFSYSLSAGLVYLLADADVITLDGQGQGILSILVIGAATDYALLIVSRYREELRRHDDRYEAMWLAWRRSVEPISASAATVVLGLLCLLLSDLRSTRGLGPVGALGVASAAATALTLLPAALVLPGPVMTVVGIGIAAGIGALTGGLPGAATGSAVALLGAVAVGLAVARRHRLRRAESGEVHELGRWLFWPMVPHLGSAGNESTGLWATVARAVGRHPRRSWILSGTALLVLAAFLPTLRADGVTTADIFLNPVESVAGGKALTRHFPGGSGNPTVVIGPADKADALLAATRGSTGVTSAELTTVAPAGAGGDAAGQGGDAARPAPSDAAPRVVDGRVEIRATLSDNADSPAADETVRRLRGTLDAVSPEALVGGTTASNVDVRDISTRDRTLIIPIILLVIFLVLAALLRSLAAPMILILANVLSFAATMGVSAIFFNHVFDFPGADPGIPLYGFVFLVALGIDYSIFLMTRVREESIRQGTREGILTGLAVTGGVITSAGVVLAATFAALGVIPILFLVQTGFVVAFGVLLDTFVVRSLLVPALAHEIGKRTWWPSKLAR